MHPSSLHRPFPKHLSHHRNNPFRKQRPYSRDGKSIKLCRYQVKIYLLLIIRNNNCSYITLKKRNKNRENYPCSGSPYLVNVESAFPGELGLELVASIFALSIMEHWKIQHDTMIKRHFHAAIFELDAEITGCFMQPLREEALVDAAICALLPCRDIQSIGQSSAHIQSSMVKAMVLHRSSTFREKGSQALYTRWSCV